MSHSLRYTAVLSVSPFLSLHPTTCLWFPTKPSPIPGVGDSKPRHIIYNNSQIDITQNVFEVLHQFRKQDRDRSMWVDALCINRSDDGEKSSQILLMKHIYAPATCALIWLGLPDKFTEYVLSLVDRAARLLRKETGRYILLESEMRLESQNAHKNEERDFPPFDAAQRWKPLLKL